MRRVAHLDCTSGASGDMLLGAFVDLGLPVEDLRQAIEALDLRGVEIHARKVLRSGLSATKVDVLEGTGAGAGRSGDAATGGPAHAHRTFRHIEALLGASGLTHRVTARAVGLFRRLAEVEGAVHGIPPEDVHFHEVGAADSIVDIVGAVVGFEWLGAERVVASPLNVGSGFVTMSHGTFPIPPPATARLVAGVPICSSGEGELLTPTGALLVTAYASEYGGLPAMRPERVGYGAGTREYAGRPNVLRLMVGAEEALVDEERVLVLETEIDDTPPFLLGPLLERLIEVGAHDAYFTAVQMKKGRPGVLITVIAPPSLRGPVEELLFAETTTLGVRCQEWARTALEREVVAVESRFGPIGVKLGRRGGRLLNAQPEFADCQRAATAAKVPIKEVWAAALSAYRDETRS